MFFAALCLLAGIIAGGSMAEAHVTALVFWGGGNSGRMQFNDESGPGAAPVLVPAASSANGSAISGYAFVGNPADLLDPHRRQAGASGGLFFGTENGALYFLETHGNVTTLTVLVDSSGDYVNEPPVAVSTNAPEPASWALMMLGFAGLALAARRPHRHALTPAS